jgi:hypothetical protein
MDVKVSSNPEPNPTLEPHHIYLRSGQVVSVLAYTYRVNLNKQKITFYNSETDRSKKVFWQLTEVAGVVAGSALAELPPLVKLQSQVEAITARIDTFETGIATRFDALALSINETIKRAIREELSSSS